MLKLEFPKDAFDINGSSDGLTFSPKLLADDTSLFYIADDVNLAANNLNNDKWMCFAMEIEFQYWLFKTSARVYF